MRYKIFKGNKVSEIGLGCWAFGGTWNDTEDQKSIATIRKAVEMGINFLDTAPVYGFGHSEKIVGEALKAFKREDVFVATKCGLIWDENKNITNNLSKESILKEIDESLERLQMDYVDLYQLHWPDPATDLEETIEALKILKESGKIKNIGVSNFSYENFKRLDEELGIMTYQGLYNMLEHNPDSYHNIPLIYRAKDDILPYCREKGIAYLPYSPLMQGLLTGTFKEENNFDENDSRYANPKLRGDEYKKYYKTTEELKALAAEIGKPLAQVAINWLTVQPEVGPIICGAQTPEQIEENLKSTEWQVTSQQLKEINAILERNEID